MAVTSATGFKARMIRSCELPLPSTSRTLPELVRPVRRGYILQADIMGRFGAEAQFVADILQPDQAFDPRHQLQGR